MTRNEILALNTTKTEKIRLLLELGMTRTQIAETLGIGYGFVQNVYARIYGVSRTNNRANTVLDIINRKFGIELEMYNIDSQRLATALQVENIDFANEAYNHTTRTHWKAVRDGSINGINPVEVVSPILQGRSGIEQVKKVCKVLNELDAKVNTSCGFHVHFDANDFTIKQWQNLIINYAKLEQYIDGMMPISRRGNNNQYCQSIKEKVLNRIEAVRTAENLRDIERVINLNSRYFKLNIQSFWRQGTVEFRQHSGTVNFQKISKWVEFLYNLISYSKTNEIQNVEEFINTLPSALKNYLTTRRGGLAA